MEVMYVKMIRHAKSFRTLPKFNLRRRSLDCAMDLRCWCETFAIMLLSPRKRERVMSRDDEGVDGRWR